MATQLAGSTGEVTLDLNSYQEQAMKFARYNHKDYPFLALGEEAGEVLGKLAKHVRKDNKTLNMALYTAMSNTELHEAVKSELGDVLWQLQACCFELGIKLEDLAQDNLDKLSGRNDRGTIVGSGDNR